MTDTIGFDIDHIEKRAKEVLAAAPEQARLGRPDIREWWCEIILLLVAKLRTSRTEHEKCLAEIEVLRRDLSATDRALKEVLSRSRECGKCDNCIDGQPCTARVTD